MSKKGQKALASATIMSLVLTTALTTMPVMAETTVGAPISGADRVATSIQIAEKAYTNKDWTTSTNAVIASGADASMVDALAIAPLAYQKKAPILLTDKKGVLTDAVITELTTRKITNVYLVGAACTDANIAKLAAAKVTVTKYQGKDRGETADIINTELEKLGAPKAYAVVDDHAMADALSIAAIAASQNYEIVLSKNNTVAKDLTGKTVYAVGGSGVLSDALVSSLKATRLSQGTTRYGTNAAVLAKTNANFDTTYVADGTNDHLVDALSGSILAAQTSSPIVLVNTAAGLDTDVTAAIKAQAGKVNTVTAIGGAVTTTITDAVKTAAVAGDLLVDSVSAVGIKKIQVKFNQAVDTTKVVLNIMKGAAVYGSTVTWNDAKDTATLTTIVQLPAADYTIQVTGLTDKALTKAFTVADPVASKVEITSKSVDYKDNGTIAFVVSNQYGEDMKVGANTTGVVVSAYDTTQKVAVAVDTTAADGTLKLTNLKTAGAKLGDVVRVTLTYAGLTAQANVTVADLPSNATIAFGDIAPLKDTARITAGDTGLVVPYTMADQYGTAAKLSAHTANLDGVDNIETIGNVQFVSSDPTVVDVDSFAVDTDGKLTFNALAAGTAVITASINESGAVAKFTVTVNKAAAVDSLAITAPTKLVAAGESVSLDLTATDQFGGVVAAKDIAVDTITSSDPTVVANDANLKIVNGKLNVATIGAGKTTITAKVGTKVVGSVTVVVEEAAKPAQVKAVSFAPKFEVGAVNTMTAKDFTVLDQYGRTIPAADVTFTVAKKTDSDTDIFTKADLATATFTAGATAGSEVFTLTASAYGKSAPAFDFTVSAIASKDITSYAITPVSTMYIEKTVAGVTDTTHDVTLELVGKTAAGETVVLNAGKVTNATTSDASVATVTSAGVVKGVAKGTTVIALWNGATKLAETTVTVNDAAPVVTSVKFKDTVPTALTLNLDLSKYLDIEDQYGVTINDAGFWASSNAKVTVTNGKITADTTSVGDTVTITYVSANGIVTTVTLTK